MPPRKVDQRPGGRITKAAEGMTGAMGGLVASDPEIREMFRDLLRRSLKDFHRQMTFASPDDRAAMMKVLLPHALKELAKTDAHERDQRQAEAWERIRRVMRGELSVDELGENPFVDPVAE